MCLLFEEGNNNSMRLLEVQISFQEGCKEKNTRNQEIGEKKTKIGKKIGKRGGTLVRLMA